MNQPLLTFAGVDVTLGAACLAFASAVLALLIAIAVLAARGSRRRLEDAVRQARLDEAMEARIADLARIQAETGGRLAGARRRPRRTAGRACPRGGRAARCGLRPDRPLHGRDHAADAGAAAKPQRAHRRARPRPEEPLGALEPGRLAARRARQQAGPRRLRPGAHGDHHPGCAAEVALRLPAHAAQQHPAGLRDLPARPAPAGHRRQVSAGRNHRAARMQIGRGAHAGGPAPAPVDVWKHISDIADKVSVCPARPRTWR